MVGQLVVRMILAGSAVVFPLFAVAQTPSDPETANQVVREAKARGQTIAGQAEALAQLAWPDDGVTDPAVSALARKQLVGFGDRALAALRQRLRQVDLRFSADIAAAMIETRAIAITGRPADYLPALDDALWFGSSEAKRLAMNELAKYGFSQMVLPAIDAAHEYPQLTCAVVRALERLGDDRARHFLKDQMVAGPPACRDRAAAALATLGARAVETLRQASLDGDREIRRRALESLLPITSVDDLTILYEYLAEYPDDDPERIERVTQRALQLERLLEAQRETEAATPSPDD